MGHGVGEGCNNDIRGWSYSILHYCSIFCSSLHFLGTCLYYFTKLRFKNIVIVQALLQTTAGTSSNMEERQLHTNSCNISSLITYAILPMAQKKAFTMLPVFWSHIAKKGLKTTMAAGQDMLM